MTDQTPESAPRVLQRVVFPGADLDVVPLYVETNMERGAAELAAELTAEELGQTAPVPSFTAGPATAAAGENQTSVRFGDRLPAELAAATEPRRAAIVNAGCRASFATYFSAFPASYWRRWTTLQSVTLRMRVGGEATVILYRSGARGHSHTLETIRVDADEPVTIERTLPLTHFIDGGWYWFDIVAGHRDALLLSAEWLTLGPAAPSGRLSAGITTMNRPEFVLDQLRTLGDAPAVLELLDALYIIDQGSNKVREHPDFADAAKKLGDRLQVIEQDNLGGSGGFSRTMAETLRAGDSDYALLLDDDITLDPEGILRAVTFADLAKVPTIVGGHMFSLYDRSILNAFGETIAAGTWWWEHAVNTKPRHDFGRRNLRNTPWMHRRIDSDYNGWWMCLIPVRVIDEIGLALPIFIKWDDAEYGLRARDHGYPTVSMPGVAAWHVTWQDKNDGLDWQSYYHNRNRIITALLHSPRPHGGRVVAESAERQLQNLLSMQYSTAALRLLAIEDVLAGPQALHGDLRTKMTQLREVRQRYGDARGQADLDSFPPPRRKPPAHRAGTPTSKLTLLAKVAAGALHQFRTPRPGARQRPQVALPYMEARWWVLSKLDSAVVSSADGASAAWYQRDRELAADLGRRSAAVHARLYREWPELAARYREAAGDLTSPRQWDQTFGAAPGEPGGR